MQIGTRDLQFTIKQARNIVFLKWGGGGGKLIQKISQAEKISELIFKILIRGGRGLAYIFNFNIAHFQIYYILKNGGGATV